MVNHKICIIGSTNLSLTYLTNQNFKKMLKLEFLLFLSKWEIRILQYQIPSFIVFLKISMNLALC